jgi:hypothetical protein
LVADGSDGPVRPSAGGTRFTLRAALLNKNTGRALQQFFLCELGWGELGVTPGNPTDLTYSVYLFCPPDAPDMTGSVQARLLNEDREVIHEAPPEIILPLPDPIPDVSEATVSIAWPVNLIVQNRSEIVLLSTDPDDVWVWGPLPPGCVGTATTVALCELDWEFTLG